MFGESNSASSVGPRRRGLWTGVAVGCLLLITAAVLVSGTVDGLNLFGRRLPDSTPNFPEPPKEPDPRTPERPEPPISLRSSASAPGNAAVPAPTTAPVDRRSVTPAPRETPREAPPCVVAGYAAVLDPATDPIGTALARSLRTSDLRARIIDPSGGVFGHEDIERIMAGDGSAVAGKFSEGTLLVAQLKIYVRQAVIDQAQMTDVGGTMDLAIVRNNCGTITVARHRNVSGKSVNETLDDGIRGLGEIFKEKIADLVRKTSGDKQ